MSFTSQRLSELYSGHPASPDEVKELAELVDTHRRRAGTRTLRDDFVMAALTGLLAHRGGGYNSTPSDAYEIADAMMEARGG